MKYLFFSIAFISILTIAFLLRKQKKQRDWNQVEDTFFLVHLLIIRLNEEADEMKEKINEKEYRTLKDSIKKIKLDFFGK